MSCSRPATPSATVALHLPERDVVISGDALVTHDPYTDTRGPRIVARGATADSERALASLDLLASTGAGTLLPGHGEPWTGGAERAVGRSPAGGRPLDLYSKAGPSRSPAGSQAV